MYDEDYVEPIFNYKTNINSENWEYFDDIPDECFSGSNRVYTIIEKNNSKFINCSSL